MVISDRKGNIRDRIGGPVPGHEGQSFIAPHGLARDSKGVIYVADLAPSTWNRFFDVPAPAGLSSLVRVQGWQY